MFGDTGGVGISGTCIEQRHEPVKWDEWWHNDDHGRTWKSNGVRVTGQTCSLQTRKAPRLPHMLEYSAVSLRPPMVGREQAQAFRWCLANLEHNSSTYRQMWGNRNCPMPMPYTVWSFPVSHSPNSKRYTNELTGWKHIKDSNPIAGWSCSRKSGKALTESWMATVLVRRTWVNLNFV